MVEQVYEQSLDLIKTAGMLAPLFFIALHVMRPILFLPVVLLCITGGVLFGPLMGTIYSLIGITLSSLVFYTFNKWLPGPFAKITALKEKFLGEDKVLTIPQIALLRLVPFMHFYLLSLCLYEISAGFKDYAKISLFTNVPLALIYTVFGGWMTKLPPVIAVGFVVLLIPAMYILRQKQAAIRWQDFFQPGTS